jgi:predicted lipoprotein with Yx(FWY)xxD motif
MRLLLVVVCALLLAACGSGGGSPPTTPTEAPTAVHTMDHPTLGAILVDSAGMTLYFADQESDGTIECVDECLGFWFPVAPATRAAPTLPGVSGLGVVHRSDNGQDQLTYQGRPLYTFRLDDHRGDIGGDNLSDAFGGTVFTWHAARVADTTLPRTIG